MSYYTFYNSAVNTWVICPNTLRNERKYPDIYSLMRYLVYDFDPAGNVGVLYNRRRQKLSGKYAIRNRPAMMAQPAQMEMDIQRV